MNLGRMNIYRAVRLLNHHAHLGATDWRIDENSLDVVSDHRERIGQHEAIRLAEQYRERGRVEE